MTEWDLSNTIIANSGQDLRPPSEGELLVLLAAMLLQGGRSFSDLADHALVLTEGNAEGVARIIEERLGSLAPEIGTRGRLRARLTELIGLKVRNPAGGPWW